MKIMVVLGRLAGGGAERVATLWCSAFVELGHEVLFASDKERKDAPFVYPIDERVEMAKCFDSHNENQIGWRRFMAKYVSLPYRVTRCIHRWVSTCSAIRKTINLFNPDFIIGVMQPASTQALVASIGFHCLVIATEHNAFDRPEKTPLSLKQKFFKFTANKWFNAVTVLTEADKEFIGDRLKNVHVMPNPLAFETITEGGGERNKRILAAGRLDVWHYKGLDLLIRAWGMIAEKYPEWVLDIAGETHREDNKTINFLEKLIEENGVKGRCMLSGFHTDVEQYFRESEIFVLSSRYEGFGMVLIEAMSQGCACIACDYKGRQREIIRNDSEGLCIPPDDVDAIASAIEKMICDEEYRKLVQHNAVKRAGDYSPIKIARMWEELIENVLHK